MALLVPRWLPNEPDPPNREALISAVVEHLTHREEPAHLVGPPGCGKTTVAGAVARRLDTPVVAARLAGCRQVSDAVLQIGWAVGAETPGDEGAVGHALAELGDGLVLLDDADVGQEGNALNEILPALSTLAPNIRWLTTTQQPLDNGRAFAVDPLPGITNPLADAPADMFSSLPDRAAALSLFPAGLPGQTPLPPALLVPGPPGRQTFRRSVADTLRTRQPAPVSRIAAGLVPLFEHLLDLATGSSIRTGAIPADMMALRWMGEVLSDPYDACRASAAAARMLTAWGQLQATRDLLAQAQRRAARAMPSARALLLWANAKAQLANGELEAAEGLMDEIAALLDTVSDIVLLATMTRRWGDALAARGEPRRASKRYREARALHRECGDTAGVAATLRGAADVAVASGETVSAEALYDQADATPGGPVEVANRRLGQCGLALARGEFRRAGALLEAAAISGSDVYLLHANLLRRRSDLAIRRGQHDAATALAKEAVITYARAGHPVAAGHATRLLGDIAAARGQIAQAATHYKHTIERQVRTRDLSGLVRTLRHAAALEIAADNFERGTQFTRMADGLAVAMDMI